MIPRDFITEWRAHAAWTQDAQVEQDLVISRALVEMFRVGDIAEHLAFRGGTALYKLHLLPAARYSEDIDLVQVQAEPIGEMLDLVRSVLDPWLGTPQRKFNEGRVNLVYRFDSEDAPPLLMRLKIEINSREHFTELGLTHIPVRVDSRWFSGAADVTTFEIDELLGTKLRALYQRKKGRDLYDLWLALRSLTLDDEQVVECFERYLEEGHTRISRAEFEANLTAKLQMPAFLDDIAPLLPTGAQYDVAGAAVLVRDRLIAKLRGEPWKGAVK